MPRSSTPCASFSLASWRPAKGIKICNYNSRQRYFCLHAPLTLRRAQVLPLIYISCSRACHDSPLHIIAHSSFQPAGGRSIMMLVSVFSLIPADFTDNARCLLVVDWAGERLSSSIISSEWTLTSCPYRARVDCSDSSTTWDLPRLYSHVTPRVDDFRYEYKPKTMDMPAKTLENWKAYTRRLMHMLPDFVRQFAI